MKRLCLLGLLGSVFFSSAVLADSEIGRLALVNGDVRIAKTEAPADKGRGAKPNDVIYNSDIVKTGESATAKILFADQSLMDVGPGSALQVSNFAVKEMENRTGTFSILYGKLRALVTKKVGDNGKVEVRSGDAVMGVRGTEFVVEVPRRFGGMPGGATQIIVVSGLVMVRPPAGGPPISVGAGQMVVASAKSFAQAASAQPGSDRSDSKENKSDSKESKSDSKANSSDSKNKAGGEGGGDSSGGAVTKVSAEQMQSALSGSKAEDNTMRGALLIADGGAGGVGNKPPLDLLPTGPVAAPPPPPPKLPPPPPASLPPVSIVPGNQVHLIVNVQ